MVLWWDLDTRCTCGTTRSLPVHAVARQGLLARCRAPLSSWSPSSRLLTRDTSWRTRCGWPPLIARPQVAFAGGGARSGRLASRPAAVYITGEPANWNRDDRPSYPGRRERLTGRPHRSVNAAPAPIIKPRTRSVRRWTRRGVPEDLAAEHAQGCACSAHKTRAHDRPGLGDSAAGEWFDA